MKEEGTVDDDTRGTKDLPPLPREWELKFGPHVPDNTAKKTKDFSDVRRLGNSMLRRLYGAWQNEIPNLNRDHATKMETAMMGQTLAQRDAGCIRAGNPCWFSIVVGLSQEVSFGVLASR